MAIRNRFPLPLIKIAFHDVCIYITQRSHPSYHLEVVPVFCVMHDAAARNELARTPVVFETAGMDAAMDAGMDSGMWQPGARAELLRSKPCLRVPGVYAWREMVQHKREWLQPLLADLMAAAWRPDRHVAWCLPVDDAAEVLGASKARTE
jgi:hypothetical protein